MWASQRARVPQTASPANEAPAPTPTSAVSAGPKLKFRINSVASATAPSPADGHPGEAPKQKRKYTKKPKFDENGNAVVSSAALKKRARDENGDDASPAAKRKPKPTAKSLALAHSDDDEDELGMAPTATPAAPLAPPVRTGSMLKLKMKPKGHPGPPQRSNTAMIKIKGVHGKPPVRPPGVGYDSEAEEAEEDPAIESQFILRMQPGPDCDLLRRAIEEKKLGKPASDGGTAVQFRFFDREGRRTLVSIHGRLYAASMVDLPCVIESMKSWNKKDWVKTADVCQMLLVLGRVQNEEEAKKFPLPREVNRAKHQYAHGLTPPMHYVRKRRFRPRQSYHEIEQQEAIVNALLDEDRKVIEAGGSVQYGQANVDPAESDDEGDQDAEGDMDEDVAETTELFGVVQTPGGDEVPIEDADADDIAAALEAGLMEVDDNDDLFGGDSLEVETPATAHDVAMHALGETAVPETETAASTPNAITSPDDDDDDGRRRCRI